MIAPTIWEQIPFISIFVVLLIGVSMGWAAEQDRRIDRGLRTNILVCLIGATLVSIIGTVLGVNIKLIIVGGYNIGIAPLAIFGSFLALFVSGLLKGKKNKWLQF